MLATLATLRSAAGLAGLAALACLLCTAAVAGAPASACSGDMRRFIDDRLLDLKDDILTKLAEVSITQFRLQMSIEGALSGVDRRLGALEDGLSGACARDDLVNVARELAAVAGRLAERQRAVDAATRHADRRRPVPENATSARLDNFTDVAGTPLAATERNATDSEREAPAARDVWRAGEAPEEDELDAFMVSDLGCSYHALEPLERLSDDVAYDGALRWRIGVRAHDRFVLHVSASWDRDYYFFIGDTPSEPGDDGPSEHEQVTKLFQAAPWRKLQERATPAVLAADRYAPLEVTIRQGTLALWAPSAGAGAGASAGAPLAELAADISPGPLMIQMYSFSDVGAKFVLDCSAPAAD